MYFSLISSIGLQEANPTHGLIHLPVLSYSEMPITLCVISLLRFLSQQRLLQKSSLSWKYFCLCQSNNLKYNKGIYDVANFARKYS